MQIGFTLSQPMVFVVSHRVLQAQWGMRTKNSVNHLTPTCTPNVLETRCFRLRLVRSCCATRGPKSSERCRLTSWQCPLLGMCGCSCCRQKGTPHVEEVRSFI
eukprot:PhF_6_TR38606/c0_g1_i1/m.57471